MAPAFATQWASAPARGVSSGHPRDAHEGTCGTQGAPMCTISSVTPTAPIAALTIPARQWDDAFGYSMAASGARGFFCGRGRRMNDDSAPKQGAPMCMNLGHRPPLPGAIPSGPTLTNPSPRRMLLRYARSLLPPGTRVAFGAYAPVALRVMTRQPTSPSPWQPCSGPRDQPQPGE